MVCDKLNELVSIHALLAECDRVFVIGTRWHPVSIHALLAECDFKGGPQKAARNRFQSTHSLRSATDRIEIKQISFLVSIHALLAECDIFQRFGGSGFTGFNPRTPCGVRHYDGGLLLLRYGFNPRTPCGVRPRLPTRWGGRPEFQSTHSLRSATAGDGIKPFNYEVSIHALLAECDSLTYPPHVSRYGFNPRTPCGVRPHRRR